jgi:hypothetical protein
MTWQLPIKGPYLGMYISTYSPASFCILWFFKMVFLLKFEKNKHEIRLWEIFFKKYEIQCWEMFTQNNTWNPFIWIFSFITESDSAGCENANTIDDTGLGPSPGGERTRRIGSQSQLRDLLFCGPPWKKEKTRALISATEEAASQNSAAQIRNVRFPVRIYEHDKESFRPRPEI